MNFFFDNNISPKLARAIDALEGDGGNSVTHLRERFAVNASDEDWISSLGQESGWVVVTSDYRITKNPHEIRAWQESGLTVFFLRKSWLHITLWEQAWQLIKRWPQIVDTAGRESPGSRFIVPIRGTKLHRI